MVNKDEDIQIKLNSLKGCVDELYEKFDQINDELKRLNEDLKATNIKLKNMLSCMNLTDNKVLSTESYFGVLTQRLDDLENRRRFEENKREKQIHKIKILIQFTLIAISIFAIGYCCGVLQWK